MLQLLENSQRAAENLERSIQQRRRFIRLTVLVISLLLIPSSFLGANVWMSYRQQNSVWQSTGFPADAVTNIAPSFQQAQENDPRVCLATADIGVGCSVDLMNWNIYQIGFPVGEPAWLNNRNTWWGSLTGRVWSTMIRGIDAIAFDRRDSQRVLAVVDQAGLFVSEDAGANWTGVEEMISDVQASPARRVRRLEVVDNDVLLLRSSGSLVDLSAEERGALYLSRNGGDNWHRIGGPQSPTGMIRDFVLIEEPLLGSYRIIVVSILGIFTTSPEANWKWQALYTFRNSEEPLLLKGDQAERLYIAIYTRESKTTTLLLWNPLLEKEPKLFAEVKGVAQAMAVAATGVEEHPIWLLLEDGGLLSLTSDGEQTEHPGRPGWGWAKAYDLKYLEIEKGATILLMGHRDGLLCYHDNSEKERTPCSF